MRKPFEKKNLTFAAIIAAVIAVCGFFMASVELPAWSHWLSGLNVLLFALPSFWVTKRWLGTLDALLLWGMLGLYAIAIETVAIETGFPYGHFGYSALLGAKLFGVTPWTVFLAWTPLVIGAYGVAGVLTRSSILRILLTAIFTTAFDLVLDPGAVRLGFWQYAETGWWYGVPVSNYAGWVFSSLIAAVLIDAFRRVRRPLLAVPVKLSLSALMIVWLWTCIAASSGLLVVALIGAAIAIGIAFLNFRYAYRFDEMLVLCNASGEPIATLPKAEVHTGDTPLHLAFSIFLFDRKGRLLLQQRAFEKSTWGGVWSNSCCGHQVLNESASRAAVRRLQFELGLGGIKLHCILPEFRYRAERDGVVENEICPVFVGFTDAEPRPEPSEVASVQWVNWNDILRQDLERVPELSPWALEEIELLRDDDEFKRLTEQYFTELETW